MNADLLTIIILAVSTLLLVVSETHVAFVTLAMCAGFVLSIFVGPEIYDFFSASISSDSFPLFTVIQLILIFLPAVLIAHRFRRSQRGPSRFIQQIIPSFALSLLVIVFLFDTLPPSSKEILRDESYIHSNFSAFQGWIVVFAIGAALFDVLTQHAGPKRKYKKRNKH